MPPAAASSSPPSRWQILRGCRLGGAPIPVVLMHPRHGVVLVGGPPDGPALLRHRLEQVRFPVVFNGYLPVIQLGSPGCPVEPAFAAQPPLTVPGGDAWIAAVERALTRDPPPPLPERLGILARHRRQRARLMLAGSAAVLSLGALALGIALLPPTPGPQLAEVSPTGSWEAAMEAVTPLVPAPGGLSSRPPLPAAPPAIPLPALAPPPQPLPPLPPDGPAPPLPAPAAAPPPVGQAVAAAPVAAPPSGSVTAHPVPLGVSSAAPSPMLSPASARTPRSRARLVHAGVAAEPSGGVARCRRILQRLQIGETVPNGDFRFLQSGCPT